jgi:acyl dehydratase
VSLAVGRRMSSNPVHLTRDRLQHYLNDIRETDPLYARANLVHPAFMLRLANLALKDNVRLAAWIHAASAIRHCGLAHAGESLTAHAEVAANYERKGHRFVDLDVVVVAEGIRPVAQVRHTAIYRLRQAE